ncbi:hypothetical protein PV768_16210 [Pseudarthrobacter sp. CC4]|uniref:hypothetical protein n=1 Tax=Pseudarthrobacter sp. CC4 TaxID=3029190 RepID=UPI003B8E6149
MNTALIALAATAAALALTWFFCMRPMRGQARSDSAGCCPPPAQNIDDRLRAAREELARLQAGRPGSDAEGLFAPPVQSIDDQLQAAREELARLQAGRPGGGQDTIPPHR